MLLRCLFLLFAVGSFELQTFGAPPPKSAQPEWFHGQYSSRNVIIMLRNASVQMELMTSSQQQSEIEELSRDFRRQTEEVIPGLKISKPQNSEERKLQLDEIKAAGMAIEEEFRGRVWKTLTPKQRDRATQILRQLDVAFALATDNNVGAAIRLTPQQNAATLEILNRSTREMGAIERARPPLEDLLIAEEAIALKRDQQTLDVFTDEQRSEWQKLIGKPIDVPTVRPAVSYRKPQE